MLNHQPCPKHPLKYFGSFGVLKCKDSTAYCLALPEQCKIHLVFNASQVTTNDLTLYPFIHTSVPWDPWAAWSRVLDNMPLLPESILVRTGLVKRQCFCCCLNACQMDSISARDRYGRTTNVVKQCPTTQATTGTCTVIRHLWSISGIQLEAGKQSQHTLRVGQCEGEDNW
jgi:hypothetical protein